MSKIQFRCCLALLVRISPSATCRNVRRLAIKSAPARPCNAYRMSPPSRGSKTYREARQLSKFRSGLSLGGRLRILQSLPVARQRSASISEIAYDFSTPIEDVHVDHGGIDVLVPRSSESSGYHSGSPRKGVANTPTAHAAQEQRLRTLAGRFISTVKFYGRLPPTLKRQPLSV